MRAKQSSLIQLHRNIERFAQISEMGNALYKGEVITPQGNNASFFLDLVVFRNLEIHQRRLSPGAIFVSDMEDNKGKVSEMEDMNAIIKYLIGE